QLLVREAQAGKKVIAVVDEAQNLDVSVLETVRLLSDFETPRAKLLHIILTGQPELADRLASPALLQLRQRISHLVRLEPLTPAEVNRYIDHRLRTAGYSGAPLFTPQARTLIAQRSEGIPRIINNLCFNALSLGFATSQRTIGPEILAEVSADLDFESIIQARKAEAATAAEMAERSVVEPGPAAATLPPEAGAFSAPPAPQFAEPLPPLAAAMAAPSAEFAPAIPAAQEELRPAAAAQKETGPPADAVSDYTQPEPAMPPLPPGPVLVPESPHAAAGLAADEVASAEQGNLALRIMPAEAPAATPLPMNGSSTAATASGNGSGAPAAPPANGAGGARPEKRKGSVDVEALAADCALFGMEAPRRWKRPVGRIPAAGPPKNLAPSNPSVPASVGKPAVVPLPVAGAPAAGKPGPANGTSAKAPVTPIGQPPTRAAVKPGQGKLWPARPAAPNARRGRRQRSLYLAAGASLLLLLLLVWLLGASSSAPSQADAAAAGPSAPSPSQTAPADPSAGNSDSSVLDVVEELPRPGEDLGTRDTRPAVVMRGTRSGEQLLRRVDPVYPAAARANRIQGPVVLDATIGTHGFLRHIRVVSGDPLLAESVLDAVKGWRYRPHTERGRAVEAETRIVVNFQLISGPRNSESQ
ncbi:MAG TPA: TonB family protein, partial [Terriglobales bacterium]|nr:TonB family protein [Terriglobales bacterium]